MLDEDLEQFLLGFDAIRSAQAVPKRWSKAWDDRLKRGHEVFFFVTCWICFIVVIVHVLFFLSSFFFFVNFFLYILGYASF